MFLLRVRRDIVDIPVTLTGETARQARLEIVQYLRLPADSRAQRRPPLPDRLYRSSDIVEALRRLFRDKCAYCESAVPRGDENVEHFRPLAFARGLDGEEDRDYYVWLALEWENLLLACATCAKAKGSLFPVADRRARIRATYDEVLATELAELLDPTRDDPWHDLRMTTDGFCRPQRRRGEVTVAALQLNRERLVARRAKDLADLRNSLPEALRTGEDERLSLLFHPSREYIGSRLDALHRTLMRWSPSASRVPAARHSLPAWFQRLAGNWSEGDRERFQAGFEEIFREDESLSPPPPGPLDELAKAASQLPQAAPSGRGRRFPDREIASIEIHDFKGIERLKLEFARPSDRRLELPALMLLGENAAGKSTILEAVALALLGTRGAARIGVPLSDFLRRDDPLGWHIINPPPPYVEIRFRDEGDPAALTIEADGRHLAGTVQPSVQVLAYGARRHFSDNAGALTRPVHFIRNLLDPDRPLPSPGPWLQQISENEETFGAVARALREVLALDVSDELLIDDSGRPSVRVLGRPVPVERLSEGYRTLFSLAVDIMRNLLRSWPDLERARAVVLIDEIETHLHPRWKMRVVSSFRRAFPGVQFIVTTHDPLCLRGMDDGEVEVIERDAEGRAYRLDDLPSVRGMRAEQLLTSEYFGLNSTADPELELEIARLSEGLSPPEADRADDEALVARIVLGDTLKQQLIHEAVDIYLGEREQRRGNVRARREAIDAVLEVLEGDSAGEAAR
jgi:uncharacterized protein (TIGR02646 family)